MKIYFDPDVPSKDTDCEGIAFDGEERVEFTYKRRTYIRDIDLWMKHHKNVVEITRLDDDLGDDPYGVYLIKEFAIFHYILREGHIFAKLMESLTERNFCLHWDRRINNMIVGYVPDVENLEWWL